MGNIKQTFVKRQAFELVKQNADKFAKDFDKNKQIIKEMNVIESKTVRNRVAGYIVGIIKRQI